MSEIITKHCHSTSPEVASWQQLFLRFCKVAIKNFEGVHFLCLHHRADDAILQGDRIAAVLSSFLRLQRKLNISCSQRLFSVSTNAIRTHWHHQLHPVAKCLAAEAVAIMIFSLRHLHIHRSRVLSQLTSWLVVGKLHYNID